MPLRAPKPGDRILCVAGTTQSLWVFASPYSKGLGGPHHCCEFLLSLVGLYEFLLATRTDQNGSLFVQCLDKCLAADLSDAIPVEHVP